MSQRKSNCVSADYPPAALLRLEQVLTLVPVSKSSWWLGVKTGRFPRSFKLGRRTTVWRAADIYKLIDGLGQPDAHGDDPR
jgi:predicted DNA-binding transcriptional regulator AlpA